MIGLAYWNSGFKIMSANKALKTPADFAGLNMRVHSSKVLSLQMEALGAAPQILEAHEVYPALQVHAIDGTESTPASFVGRKWYEVQKHVTISNHGYVGSAVVVNKKFWEGLPSDLRNVIEVAMREATTYGNTLAEQENAAALERIKKMKKLSVYTLTEKDTAAWRQALLPVQKELEARIGKAIVFAVTRDPDPRHASGR
jgi:C4-dicarboxylate-binding protein DctP